MKTSYPLLLAAWIKPLDVLDGLVLRNAVADQLPGDALLTQEIILRIGNQHCCIVIVDIDGPSPLDS